MTNEFKLDWYSDGYSGSHIRGETAAFRAIEDKIRELEARIKVLESPKEVD